MEGKNLRFVLLIKEEAAEMEETGVVATFLVGGGSCATASRSIPVMLGRATSRRLMRAPLLSRERGVEKKRRRERQRERERERRGKERRMVFNSRWVATVATLSADACQYVACNLEWLSSEQVLDLVCWLLLHHLRRLAICLFSFFCFPIAIPPPNSRFYAYHRSFSASSSSSSEDYDSAGYDSHSD